MGKVKVIPEYELDAVRAYVMARCEQRTASDRHCFSAHYAAKRRQARAFAHPDRRVWGALDVARRVLDSRLDLTDPSLAMLHIVNQLA